MNEQQGITLLTDDSSDLVPALLLHRRILQSFRPWTQVRKETDLAAVAALDLALGGTGELEGVLEQGDKLEGRPDPKDHEGLGRLLKQVHRSQDAQRAGAALEALAVDPKSNLSFEELGPWAGWVSALAFHRLSKHDRKHPRTAEYAWQLWQAGGRASSGVTWKGPPLMGDSPQVLTRTLSAASGALHRGTRGTLAEHTAHPLMKAALRAGHRPSWQHVLPVVVHLLETNELEAASRALTLCSAMSPRGEDAHEPVGVLVAELQTVLEVEGS